MKIVFNSHLPDAVATSNYGNALKSIPGLSQYVFGQYDRFEVGLFMPYREDLAELRRAREQNPNLRIGLIDPRGHAVEEYLPEVDFIIIDSIEMRDYFARYRIPMFCYYEYPVVRPVEKVHRPKSPVVIGYHGNKVHLMGMYPNVTRALELVAEAHPVELLVVYNVEKLGEWTQGVPRGVKVRHVQWTPTVYNDALVEADIGIAPNLMPLRDAARLKTLAQFGGNPFLGHGDDYLTRYKVPSNPGRMIIFGHLGIPVITDFFPSGIDFIRHGENGLLAVSCGGWYTALEALVRDHALRQRLADAFRPLTRTVFDFETQNRAFAEWLHTVPRRLVPLPYIPEPAGDPAVFFPDAPPRRGFFGRLAGRFRA